MPSGWIEKGIPTPGSDEALNMGCKCPVLDNNRGTVAPWPPDGWWMNGECELHSPRLENEEPQS